MSILSLLFIADIFPKMTSRERERIVSPWTKLLNRVNVIVKFSEEYKQLFKLDPFEYRQSQRTVQHKYQYFDVGVTFMGSRFQVVGQKTKKEARDQLAAKLVNAIDGFPGLGRVSCYNTSSLQVQQTQVVEGGDQLWWEIEKSKRITSRKGKGAIVKARLKL